MSDAGKYRWMSRHEASRELGVYAEVWYVVPPSREVLFGLFCGPDGVMLPGNESENHMPENARICRAMVPLPPE